MNKPIEAVVFDMDGLIFDTERLWHDSVVETNKYHNTNVPLDLVRECTGLRNDDIDIKLKSAMGEEFDTDQFREWNRYYMEKDIQENNLKVKKGFLELIDYLQNNNIKFAIASSSEKREIEKRFMQAKLDINVFNYVIGGEMVSKAKPDPEIYIRACEMLGVNPDNAIALEDSNNGIISAYQAGMKPILIPDITINTDYVKSIAYRVLEDLSCVIDVIEEDK